MESLIQNSAKLGITRSAYSLTTNGNYYPENVFVDNSNFFHSISYPSNQWWQVSFSEPVSISSYIIKSTYSGGCFPKSWIVNASFDNKTWETVDTKTNENTGNVLAKFELTSPINTKHFRIVLKENTQSASDNHFIFTFFDCFGAKGKMKSGKKANTCYVSYLKYKLFVHVFISSLCNYLIT